MLNKSVGFRFSSRRLSAIVQYIEHADNLDLKEERSQIDSRLDTIIHSLQGKQYSEIPQILASLSAESDLLIQKYSDLGLEIKSFLQTKIKESCTSALQKVLPQLLWLLILLVVYLVLMTLFPTIELPFP